MVAHSRAAGVGGVAWQPWPWYGQTQHSRKLLIRSGLQCCGTGCCVLLPGGCAAPRCGHVHALPSTCCHQTLGSYMCTEAHTTHLVPVVLLGVVRRRDHDARRRAQHRHARRHEGRGHQRPEQVHPHALASKHARSGVREAPRSVASVVACMHGAKDVHPQSLWLPHTARLL